MGLLDRVVHAKRKRKSDACYVYCVRDKDRAYLGGTINFVDHIKSV